MRDALLAIKEVADRDMRHHVSMSESDQTSIRAWANLFVSMVDSALAEPPRNCDVGTAEEHAQRFYNFCESNSSGINGMCKQTCPCIDCFDKCQCFAKWSLMPCEAQEGGAK